MPKNAIYLSGWEYNRTLQVDPLTAVQSALPAQAFWNGAAQFWLFEKVYCTRESFQGEVEALEALGWTSGYILKDLHRRGFLQIFDWKTLREDSPLYYQQLVEAHSRLREQYNETTIRQLIKTGNVTELEAIKLELLRPI